MEVDVGMWDKRLTLPISIQFANHNISRMANNRTPYSRNVTSQK